MGIRTFIAFSVDPDLQLRRVIDELSQIGPSVRISGSSTLHLTLRFLGETAEESVSELIRILNEVAAEFTAVDAAMSGLGVFPDMKKPSVVWVGVKELRTLVTLQTDLESRLIMAGWSPDKRVYRPHITVARGNLRRRRTPDLLFELLDRHTTTDFGTVHLDRIVLYQSELSSGGASYTSLYQSVLHGPGVRE
ncbi:MAG: RNA 2',3'-cyclic phosphodiesterase [Fuerstiella sp.]|nr:RNA 2',3'-cyclic phosphodiesterase [Fuerstiella sp.]